MGTGTFMGIFNETEVEEAAAVAAIFNSIRALRSRIGASTCSKAATGGTGINAGVGSFFTTAAFTTLLAGAVVMLLMLLALAATATALIMVPAEDPDPPFVPAPPLRPFADLELYE